MAPKGILVAFLGLAWLAIGPAAFCAGSELPVEVTNALQDAERAVAQARAEHALWTTAQEALERARTAAARGDAGSALAAARFAAEQAELGRAQLNYPRFDH